MLCFNIRLNFLPFLFSRAHRYELLGRKQGEEDLGEGRAGVVRKCVERQELPKEEEQQGEEAEQQLPLVRACKCISKKQQSEEETDRELAIMRKLIGNYWYCYYSKRGVGEGVLLFSIENWANACFAF